MTTEIYDRFYIKEKTEQTVLLLHDVILIRKEAQKRPYSFSRFWQFRPVEVL